MQEYVNGFMLDPKTHTVLFIEKQRPIFQKGKWNGIGGKIERGETPAQAMVREFREETGVTTEQAHWQHTLSLYGADFVVHFFRNLVSEFPRFATTTDERVGLHQLEDIYVRFECDRDGFPDIVTPLPVLDNMRWILPMQFSDRIAFPLVIHTAPAHAVDEAKQG